MLNVKSWLTYMYGKIEKFSLIKEGCLKGLDIELTYFLVPRMKFLFALIILNSFSACGTAARSIELCERLKRARA